MYYRGRNYPGISTTRSLGDYSAHKLGVTSEPKVGSYQIGIHNEYLVIATCALWNVLTPKAVFEFIKQNCNKGIGVISKLLANKVKDLYAFENKAIPDITIIIVYLNSSVVKYN